MKLLRERTDAKNYKALEVKVRSLFVAAKGDARFYIAKLLARVSKKKFKSYALLFMMVVALGIVGMKTGWLGSVGHKPAQSGQSGMIEFNAAIEAATAAMTSNDYQTALKQATDAMAAASSTREKTTAYVIVSQASAHLNKPKEVAAVAESIYQQTHQDDMLYPIIVNNLAVAYFDIDDYTRCIETQQKLVSLYDKQPYYEYPYEKATAEQRLNMYQISHNSQTNGPLVDFSNYPKTGGGQ